ncbi:MAG: DNA repair protein RadC [Anaerolineales bacterium]|nr:DNA repair protein RadC [Anaerolineales bacterium]
MKNQLAFLTFPDARLTYLPAREHPVRRVAEHPTACNLVELLAALIGGPRQVETAEVLLQQFKSLRAIRQAHAEEIAGNVAGIGLQTATRLVAALELGRRLSLETEERPLISSPADAAALLQYEMSTLEQEELRVILLNTRNRVLGIETVYRGSINSAQVRVGEIFKMAIRRNAPALILAHNHPSGDPSPSPDDVAITRTIVEAGKLLDIDLLDHLIVGSTYVSMKERGLGFL